MYIYIYNADTIKLTTVNSATFQKYYIFYYTKILPLVFLYKKLPLLEF